MTAAPLSFVQQSIAPPWARSRPELGNALHIETVGALLAARPARLTAAYAAMTRAHG
ncbi:MAG: hypothetical protein KA533_06665 [Sphingobium sp.]|nr:hypothetical protein [Sphingobium sp.]MBP6111880.1 hypothetical protein [Sphingobium sp.]MBP8670321.1 hypothetical protein [Sphingobium sp.]MBP9157717.1 hypothetical protein [Sphingobium sp.]MCC6482910.1 hypothetical protein [Sphingomonadaceae bacterium]